jgi:predicted MFS family arabinose efflux permease
MVCGIPVGAFIGQHGGWHAAFLAAGTLAALGLMGQLLFLRSVPAGRPFDGRVVLSVLAIPQVRVGFTYTALVSAGHFAGYTYLKPYLLDVAHVAADDVMPLLVVYGLAGLAGTFLTELAVRHWPKPALVGTAMLLGGAMLLAPSVAILPHGAFIVVALWGYAFGSVPITSQTWIYNAAPQHYEFGAALSVPTFQFAVALGALIGGAFIDHGGVSRALYAGGATVLLGGTVVSYWGRGRAT